MKDGFLTVLGRLEEIWHQDPTKKRKGKGRKWYEWNGGGIRGDSEEALLTPSNPLISLWPFPLPMAGSSGAGKVSDKDGSDKRAKGETGKEKCGRKGNNNAWPFLQLLSPALLSVYEVDNDRETKRREEWGERLFLFPNASPISFHSITYHFLQLVKRPDIGTGGAGRMIDRKWECSFLSHPSSYPFLPTLQHQRPRGGRWVTSFHLLVSSPCPPSLPHLSVSPVWDCKLRIVTQDGMRNRETEKRRDDRGKMIKRFLCLSFSFL